MTVAEATLRRGDIVWTSESDNTLALAMPRRRPARDNPLSAYEGSASNAQKIDEV